MKRLSKIFFNIIGKKISFPSEREKGIIPFEYFEVVKDYNGVDIKQTSHYIEMNC